MPLPLGVPLLLLVVLAVVAVVGIIDVELVIIVAVSVIVINDVFVTGLLNTLDSVVVEGVTVLLCIDDETVAVGDDSMMVELTFMEMLTDAMELMIVALLEFWAGDGDNNSRKR